MTVLHLKSPQLLIETAEVWPQALERLLFTGSDRAAGLGFPVVSWKNDL